MKKNLLRILSIILSVVIVISIVVIRRDKSVDGNLEITNDNFASEIENEEEKNKEAQAVVE